MDRTMNATDGVTGGSSASTKLLWRALGVLLVCASVTNAQAPSDKVIVADVIPQVVPQGSQSVPMQRIIELIKTRPGGDYKATTVAEAVRRLYEPNLFADNSVATQQTHHTR